MFDKARGLFNREDEATSEGSQVQAQVFSPQERIARSIEEKSITNTAEIRIKDDSGRAEIVKSLKNFARLDEAEFQKTDIHEGIKSTLTLLAHKFKDRVEVVKEPGSIPKINCYPNQLNQVFMNLFLNADQAIKEKGIIRVKTFAENKNVIIKVSDTGEGISPEHIDKVFDPGFSTGGACVGTGLGLSISYNIIQKVCKCQQTINPPR